MSKLLYNPCACQTGEVHKKLTFSVISNVDLNDVILVKRLEKDNGIAFCSPDEPELNRTIAICSNSNFKSIGLDTIF